MAGLPASATGWSLRGYTLVPVTHGRSGAEVFRLKSPDGETLYLKVAPPAGVAALLAEAERLEWLHGRVSVPKVLDRGTTGEGAYLLTSALPGVPLIAFNGAGQAVKERMTALLGEALAALHATDLTGWPLGPAAPGEPAGSQGLELDPHEDERAAILEDLRSRLPAPPRPTLTHGDPCLPNVLVENGRLSGFVDLGAAGPGDPPEDLASALWSLGYNYGPGWSEVLLRAYGA